MINFLLTAIQFSLSLRFLFRLFGANPKSSFVNWLYTTTEPLIEPFEHIFPSLTWEEGFVLEFTTLIALVIYVFSGYIFLEVLNTFERKTLKNE